VLGNFPPTSLLLSPCAIFCLPHISPFLPPAAPLPLPSLLAPPPPFAASAAAAASAPLLSLPSSAARLLAWTGVNSEWVGKGSPVTKGEWFHGLGRLEASVWWRVWWVLREILLNCVLIIGRLNCAVDVSWPLFHHLLNHRDRRRHRDHHHDHHHHNHHHHRDHRHGCFLWHPDTPEMLELQ